MRKRSYGQTGPCADAFSTGLGGQGQDVVPTPVVSGDTHSGPPPSSALHTHARANDLMRAHMPSSTPG
jgi:hypothetical protein